MGSLAPWQSERLAAVSASLSHSNNLSLSKMSAGHDIILFQKDRSQNYIFRATLNSLQDFACSAPDHSSQHHAETSLQNISPRKSKLLTYLSKIPKRSILCFMANLQNLQISHQVIFMEFLHFIKTLFLGWYDAQLICIVLITWSFNSVYVYTVETSLSFILLSLPIAFLYK